MKDKLILFLDFDRTLFDTERYYIWLGEPKVERNQMLIDGTLALPDFSSFLFADTIPFLKRARERFRPVLLSYTKLEYSAQQLMLQRKKVEGSAIAEFFDEMIITTGNKAIEAKVYIQQNGSKGTVNYFVDDTPQHITEMKALNPDIVCYRMIREGGGVNELSSGSSGNDEDAVVCDLTDLLTLLRL